MFRRFSLPNWKSSRSSRAPRARSHGLRCEALETRRMLADPGDTIFTSVPGDAVPFLVPFQFTDEVGNGPWGGSDVDMFHFQAARGDQLDLSTFFAPAVADTYLRLFDQNGVEIAEDDDSGFALYSHVNLTAPYTGTYYAGVSGFPNSAYDPFTAPSGPPTSDPGLYTYTFDYVPTSDEGDTLTSALQTGLSGVGNYFAPSNAIGNHPYFARDVDIFAFEGVSGQILTIGTDYPGGAPMDTVLRLFNVFGQEVAVDDDSGPGLYSSINNFHLLATGTYHIGVSGFSNFNYDPNTADSGSPGSVGDYSLSINLVADVVAPTIDTISLIQLANPSGTYVVPVGSGDQLRSVGVARAERLRIGFSEPVGGTLSFDLTLVGDAQGVVPHLMVILYSGNDDPYLGAHYAPLAADRYTFTLNADGVHDNVGFILDGEWDNPTDLLDPSSSVVSGNGVQGGDFVFRFTVLPADANHDNQVTGADFTIWNDNFGAGPGATMSQGEFNGDGFVTGADFTIWNDLFGTDFTGPSESSAAPTVEPTRPLFEPPRLAPLQRIAPQQEFPRLDDRVQSDVASLRTGAASALPRRARLTDTIDEVLSDWEYTIIPTRGDVFS